MIRIVAPDRTSRLSESVTTFSADEVVLAGTVRGRVDGCRGAWVITRAVALDDPQWGAAAPAWSWLLVPGRDKAAQAESRRLLASLRTTLPKQRWATGIRLSKDVRAGRQDPGPDLLALAQRLDAAFAAHCADVAEERERRAAVAAERAEQILRDSLSWRDGITQIG